MSDESLYLAVSSWSPDAFVVVGWYHKVPKRWRLLAHAYGLHASLLPAYSGGAPLVWAMINGENTTGITLFQLDDGVDTGPILGQATTQISAVDTIATLYARIEELGVALLLEHLPKLATGQATLRPQPATGRRVCPQRGPEDGEIDWSKPAVQIDRFVRAQTKPYPGAFFVDGTERIIVWSVQLTDVDLGDCRPGEVVAIEHGIFAAAGDGESIRFTLVNFQGTDVPPFEWWLRRTAN